MQPNQIHLFCFFFVIFAQNVYANHQSKNVCIYLSTVTAKKKNQKKFNENVCSNSRNNLTLIRIQ